jgi:hypothetical protein
MRVAMIAVVVSAALVASLLLALPYFSLGALRSDTPVRIFALDPRKYGVGTGDGEPITMNAVKVHNLEPNSFVWFLDPYGKTMKTLLPNGAAGNKTLITLDSKQMEQFQNRDPYEYYMLIRLPVWLGGGGGGSSYRDNTSSNNGNTTNNDDNNNGVATLRAYHSISLSDKCTAIYFPQEGRTRIENPCAGDMYRAWDGFAIAGPAHLGFVGMVPSKGYYPALQMLRLSVDAEGYVVAFRPDDKPEGDGVQGEGRLMSPDALAKSNMKMVSAASQYSGFALPFPATKSPDYILDWIEPNYSGKSPLSSEAMKEADGNFGRLPLKATYISTGGNHSGITIDAFPQK